MKFTCHNDSRKNKMMRILRRLIEEFALANPFSKKLGYIGWLGYGNLGDEAMYFALRNLFSPYRTLQFRGATAVTTVERLLPGRQFQAVVLGGGTLINSTCIDVFRRALHTYPYVFTFGTGVRNPEYWSTIGIKSILHDWVECLTRCRYVGVRGPLSKQILAENGFHNAEVVGDPALLWGKATITPKTGRKILGMNIGVSGGRVWGHEDDILETAVEYARCMMQKGWQIQFLPVWHNDVPYIEEACRRLGNGVSIVRNFLSMNTVLTFLEQCDLFVGEKFHSVVLATTVYTPAVMLEYRPKCLDFMQSMGLSKYSMRTNALCTEQLLHLSEELVNGCAEHQQYLFARVEQYKRLLHDRSAEILRVISESV